MALIKCYECNEKISENAKKCPYCGALADDEPTDIRVWISLIIGGVLFYLIESNFDVNGFWNHTLLFLFFLLGFPIGTILYLSFKDEGVEKDGGVEATIGFGSEKVDSDKKANGDNTD